MDRDLVFYFSGSGNSLSVAKFLSGDKEPINISTLNPYGEYCGSSIGFVFPVYCMEAPKIVNNFIKNNKFNAPYIWAVATCAGMVGNALSKVDKLLQERGARLSYGCEITLPDSCILLASSKADKAKYLEEQDAKMGKIKEEITEKKTNIHKETLGMKIMSKASWAGMKLIASPKRANRKCIRCDLCIEICPVENISRDGYKLIFGDKCEYCFACIQFCPHNAITFGALTPSKRTHYTHPDIDMAEMIERKEQKVII